MATPKISIIIPVYNGAAYLKEAIDSALSQTYSNVEVIVINDGSDDNGATDQIARLYEGRIRYYQKENGGVASALNLGIKVMLGEYFSWLSHDDVYFKNKLDVQLKYLTKYDIYSIVYSDYQFIDSNSNYISTKKIHNIPPNRFRLALMYSHPVHGCTLLIPKICFDKIGMFKEELITSQDYDMWFRMSEYFKFVHIPEVLISSRVHKNQGSKANAPIFLNECSKFYCKCLKQILSEWDDEKTSETLENFSIKAAIFLERFGLGDPNKLCRMVIKRTWYRGLKKFNPVFYYLLCYYMLFRLKRTLF